MAARGLGGSHLKQRLCQAARSCRKSMNLSRLQLPIKKQRGDPRDGPRTLDAILAEIAGEEPEGNRTPNVGGENNLLEFSKKGFAVDTLTIS